MDEKMTLDQVFMKMKGLIKAGTHTFSASVDEKNGKIDYISIYLNKAHKEMSAPESIGCSKSYNENTVRVTKTSSIADSIK